MGRAGCVHPGGAERGSHHTPPTPTALLAHGLTQIEGFWQDWRNEDRASSAWNWNADAHNTRVVDVNGDGTDEVAEIRFVLNGTGKQRQRRVRHSRRGTRHGRRLDPWCPGMEVWSFSGLYNTPANRLTEPNTSLRPCPQLGLGRDGDILGD